MPVGLLTEAISKSPARTAWTDPELAAQTPEPLGMHVQQLLSFLMCGLLAIAIALALTLD